MKLFIYLFILLFTFSCDTPLTDEELLEIAEANDPRVKITMDMTENLELTIGIKNFEDPVAILSFELIFDPNALSLSTHAGQNFGNPSFSMDEVSDTTYASFAFFGNISGDGDLLKLNFQGSQSAYRGSTIFLRKIEMLDSGGNEIDISDDELFYSESICYIDGSATTNGDLLFGGDYRWTNGYCWHEDVYNPQP